MQLVMKEGEPGPGLWLKVLQAVLTEGNKHPRAFSVSLVSRINVDRVQSAVSLRESKRKCFFPGSSARSHPLGPPRGGTPRSAQGSGSFGVLGLWGSLGKETRERTGQSLAAPAPHSALSLWPLMPPSFSPASTRGSSPGEERNERSMEEPVPGTAGRRGRHGWGVLRSLSRYYPRSSQG